MKVELGRRFEWDVEVMLLARGVETTAGTGSVENLEEYLKSTFAISNELS